MVVILLLEAIIVTLKSFDKHVDLSLQTANTDKTILQFNIHDAFSGPKHKAPAFVLQGVGQRRIATTVIHTKLPLLNLRASVLPQKNHSVVCL